MKNIILLCSAGMSTSLIVTKMREAASVKGYECKIDAYPVNEAAQRGADADIILLGPQIRFQQKNVQKNVSCPVMVIDMTAYGTMNGKKILEDAVASMEK